VAHDAQVDASGGSNRDGWGSPEESARPRPIDYAARRVLIVRAVLLSRIRALDGWSDEVREHYGVPSHSGESGSLRLRGFRASK
jgi:hypothetical protein